MSQAPIPYASTALVDADSSHIRTLAILHYVWGGLTMLFSSIFIIHIVIGILTVNGKMAGSFNPQLGRGGQPFPDKAFGWIFIAIGSLAVILGWTCGILTILSGRWMTQRRRRIFSLVMAGVNCASFPLGTTLGVFTLTVLLKDSVRAQYDTPRLSQRQSIA